MRRTASLDTIPASRGVGALLQVNKATQTKEVPEDSLSSASTDDSHVEKMTCQGLNRIWDFAEHSVSSQTTQDYLNITVGPVDTPIRPTRNSVEGLNLEIERLVLCPGTIYSDRASLDIFRLATPEGHRAPLADLLHSVDTQTPLHSMFSSESAFGGWLVENDPLYSGSSPEQQTFGMLQGASPRINRFLTREPPDGCEKVNLRTTEKEETSEIFKPSESFQLRPSRGSAFQPLQSMKDIVDTPE